MFEAFWKDEAAGEWLRFEQPHLILLQDTASVIALFSGGIPVVMKIDEGYIASDSALSEVRQQYPDARVATFSMIRKSDKPFYMTLGIPWTCTQPATR